MATKKAEREKTETGKRQQKPIIDQMTDLAAQAAGTLAETAVRAVAHRAKKEASKRLPASAKGAARTLSDAAKDKERAPASTTKGKRKPAKKSVAKKAAPKKSTAKRSAKKPAKKSKTRR
jgi:hypothetical protein